MAQAGQGEGIGPGLAQQRLHEARRCLRITALVDLCIGLAPGQFQAFLAARGFDVAALGQLGAVNRRTLVLLHVLVGGGEGFRGTDVLAQQALHALRHALQQLWIDIIIAQPAGAGFGDLVEQFAGGMLVTHEEAGVSHGGARQWHLQACQQGRRHRVWALLLLHLLHQQAQQVEVVTVMAAELRLCAMFAAELGDNGRLQIGNAGGGTGLGLQSREYGIYGGAGHGDALRGRCAGLPGLLQQFVQGAAGGGGQPGDDRAGATTVADRILQQVRPRAGGAGPFQPVSGAAVRLAGCVARPPPTDWVMMRRVLAERAR